MSVEAVDAFQFDEDLLFKELDLALRQAAMAGASEAVSAVGVDLSTPPLDALRFARKRAAELIGKRWEKGKLITNPNPEWAITETTRKLAREKIVAALEAGSSPSELASKLATLFDPARAMTIARTEAKLSYHEGAMVGYQDAGIEHLEVLDGVGCLPTGHREGASSPSGRVGVVEQNVEANGQVWTVEQSREYSIGHPNCRRNFIPYV